jgi:glycosyltransferase involved in cell wall biosynthesis
MKIVHLEDFIHPDAGYQVNLLSRLQVLQGHEVEIVTGELHRIPAELSTFFGRDEIEKRDHRFHTETGARIHRLPLYGFYSGRAIFKPIMLVRHILNLRPDVLFVHGEDTLTGMIFIILARFLPFPLVVDCHMLEMASENRFKEYFRFFYRNFITPLILKQNIPLIRVVDTDFVEKHFGLPLDRTILLSLGTDTDFFRPNDAARHALRSELKIQNEAFVVLYAGKLDQHKGGKLLARAFKERFDVLDSRPIEIIVIGNSVGQYGAEVDSELSSSENRIIRLPTQRYLETAKYYQSSDLVVYPKQCSLSFFEAQSCGVMVLFENNEINLQRTTSGSAFTFEPDSVDDFRKKILEIYSMDKVTVASNSEKARNLVLDTYDFLPISQRYTDVLSSAVANWKKGIKR